MLCCFNSMGKSAFAINIAKNVLEEKSTGSHYQSEMDAGDSGPDDCTGSRSQCQIQPGKPVRRKKENISPG